MNRSIMNFEKTGLQREYGRNNRSKFTKALRCFPSCNTSGHSEYGFCGGPLAVVLEVPIDHDSPSCHLFDNFWKQNQYVAEMRCTDEKGLSSQQVYVDKQFVQSRIRSKEEKCNPYIAGRCTAIETFYHEGVMCAKHISLEFNTERHAWHYGWVSHKHSRFKSHVIDISVLVETKQAPDTYFIAGSYLSPEFTVTSTKRQQQCTKRTLTCQDCGDLGHCSTPRVKRARVDVDMCSYFDDDSLSDSTLSSGWDDIETYSI